MIGKITSFDPDTRTGVIQCQRYFFEFHMDQWKEEEEPLVGDDVFFVQRRNRVLEVHLAGDYLPKGEPVKSRMVAGLVSIFLGGVGAGRFYLGYYMLGIMQLIVTVATLGFGVMWGVVDGFLILSGQIFKDAKNRPLK
jgi:hypothetical protein